MKTWLLSLVLLSAVPAGASEGAPAADSCPCSHPRFWAKSEAAKAVDEFWRAREEWKALGRIYLAEYMAAGLLGTRTPGLNATENAAAAAQQRMLAARSRAVSLGGLKLHGRANNSYSPFRVTLALGVDYELAEPPPVILPEPPLNPDY